MNKILVLDISAMLYTAYYAINLSKSDGTHSGALYGFLNQLKRLYQEIKPNYIFAGRDISRKNLKRLKIYPEYKQNRPEMKEELRLQFNEINYFLDSLNIKYFEYDGEEADDILASIAEILKKDPNNEIYVYTKDKDICQILDKNVKIIYPSTDKKEKFKIVDDEEKVIEKFGVYSYQIPDLFAFTGDSSDGIPGVSGIGKGIAPYVKEYSTIENILENIEKLNIRNKKKILENVDLAKMSRELATVNRNIPLNISLTDENLFANKEMNEFLNLCDKWEFRAVKFEFEKIFNENKIKEKFEEKEEYIKVNKLEDIKFKELTYFNIDEYGFSIISGNKYYVYLFETKKDSLFYNEYDYKNELYEISKKTDMIVFNYKYARHKNINFEKFKDLSLIYHLTESTQAKTLDEVYSKYYGENIFELGVRELKKLNDFELEKYREEFLFERVKYTKRIYNDIKNKFYSDENLIKLYENLELPLLYVLYDMEKIGIRADKKYFEDLKIDFTNKINEIKQKIYDIAGEEFNLSSPKQLANILFEKMGYPIIKKTKKSVSTDIEVLEALQNLGIDIATRILEYRKYDKLITSYIDLLLDKIENERIHTTFNQNGTTTGRLSSENPNLQVIPSRTEEGILIRKGLITTDGYKLVSFDYSQIELRVLASMSKDDKLLKAYKDNLDLHKVTATRLFDKKIEDINKKERDIAKVINFSVLYGKTPFGLSKELNIDIATASKYIKDYFDEYKGVKKYIDEIVENAKKNGYVKTLLGTQRYIENINSTNKNLFEQAKRMAINTVIQGTASNILKSVMIKLQNLISKDVRMLIQIHDELIFEIKEDKVQEYVIKIKEIMEKDFELEDVKLEVNYNIGKDWSELK